MMITEQSIRDALSIDEKSRDSYLLYGSYARGDYECSSDVDVLQITTSRKRAPRLDGRALIHIYDIKDLLAMSGRGSLFILHLVHEAKPIHDPCEYLRDLSNAFRKPDSYIADAQEMVRPASALLDISESLFETAPKRFMDACVFLCRTLLYAEYADQGPFSFSLRALAAEDETASMICKIKDQSASYLHFQQLRQVIRQKVGWGTACPEARSIIELSQKAHSAPLFESLLRRIKGLDGDPYLMPTAEHLSRRAGAPGVSVT